MFEAAAWGLIGASSLLIGAVLGLALQIPTRIIGLILGFGAGTLISAVAFELTEEAFRLGGADTVALGLALGALTYFSGSVAIAHRGGAGRMRPSGREDADASTALLLGAVLDGVPESTVIGISVLEGGSVGVAVLAAVFLSNLPEALSSSRGMGEQGMGARHVLGTWALVVIASGLAAAAGYGFLEDASGDTIGLIEAFAGGAVLTMLADTMIPESYKAEHDAGVLTQRAVGLMTVVGFALAYLLSTLE
jgi:zinc transporter, ZIP family